MKKLSGWQKAGLVAGIGCFSIVGLLVLALVIATVWARSTVAELGDPNPTRVERTIALSGPTATAQDAAAKPGATPTSDEPVRLSIDLEDGDFTIRPGPPGSQVQVQGTYAEGLYELTENHGTDEASRAQLTTIRFRSKAPAWARMLAGIGSGSGGRPEVTVLIPEGAPIDLMLRVAVGESSIDLGGLTLKELGLDLSMGNHEIDFSQPVVAGLRRVRLTASMGNISVDNLGNSRAAAIDATGSMGNLTADLGGAWQPGAGAELSFTHSMGELTVRAPNEVRLEMNASGSRGTSPLLRGDENRSSSDRETSDPEAPVLRLRVTTSMGESRVRRY